MVELRKRKAPAEASVPAPKKAGSVKGVASKVKEVLAGESTAQTNGSSKAPSVGDVVDLSSFGGEIETHEGTKTSLKQLVDESKSGVVLFTYPKASTPGCTTQACTFRDEYTALTSTGFSIYGLSRDSPKANLNFKTKQSLPYTLLCDPSANLVGAIGMKKAAGTTRGVFVVDKQGHVLAAEPGSPAATVEVVRKLVAGKGSAAAGEGKTEVEPGAVSTSESAQKDEDIAHANVAAEVAETAQKLDDPNTT